MTFAIVQVQAARLRSPRRALAALLMAIGVVVPVATGCAEEEADGFEAAYPVGASVPPPARPEAPPAMPPAPVAANPPDPAEAQEGPSEPPPESSDVTVSDGPAEAPPPEGAAPPEGMAPPPGFDAQGAEAAGGPPSDADPSALTDFRSALDAYGTWVEDPTYGTVWVPSAGAVGPDFTPYETAGHWAYDSDYTWVSDYAWGWAPFHYGRWVYAGPAGWAWVPGRTYAGAWVSWRYGSGAWPYVGWAPLSPTWGWRRGVAVGLGFVPASPYAFVGSGDLFSSHLAAHAVVGSRAAGVAVHTQPWLGGASAVGGRVIARPTVGGPSPSMLRIPESAVVHGATTNRGVMQARAFARTGVSAGRASTYAAAAPRSMAPAYGPPAPSHFGGRLGAGFTGSVPAYAAARAASGPRPYYGPSASYTLGARSQAGGAAAPVYRSSSYSGSRSGGFTSTQAYSGARGVSTAAPAYSGGFRSGGFSGGASPGAGSFHGGGGSHVGGGSRGGGRGGGHR